MVDSQPMEEEFQGAATRDAGTETHGGPTKPVLQTQKSPSPSSAFIKENIDVLRTVIKEHDQQAKMKATPRKLAYADSEKEAPTGQTPSTIKSQKTPSKNKEPTHLRRSRRLEDRSTTREKARRERSKSRRKRSGHQDTSSDSEYEEGSDDACEDLNSPYKRPKPTPFTQRITRFKYHKRAKLPRNIRSVDSFKELSQKFLEEFSQQKRYAKDPIEIHGIKRRQNEGLQVFMHRFKSESSHIKGVPPVLRISAFMHGHGHPELAKKLNDKIPKTVDEMFETVRAFIRGEVAAGARDKGGPREARRNMGVYTPYPKKDTFTPLTKTLKESLAMESISFPEPPLMIGTPKKQNLNKFCDYHGDRGHNTNDCYQLKKQIEEAVASGKLAHLVKDIRQNNQRNRNPRRNGVKPVKTQKMQDSDDRLFKGNISSPRSNRPSSNFRKGRKKQDGANGVCNNKMSFAVQHHNRKDRNEKPQSSGIREQVILRTKSNSKIGPTSDLMSLERTWGRENAEEAFTISHELPDQYVTMGTTMTTNCKQLMADVLRENIEKMMEKVLADQRGWNVETYLEEIVIKSKSELGLVQDVKETLRKLKRVNIKIDPTMSSFRVKEGRKRVQALIHTARSLRAVFRKHKVKVVTDGPMEETLKLAGREGRLGKWATEIRTYDISYVQRKEAEGPVVKKFFGQGEQVE
ncbi:hypothetical protein Tco_0772928 [Tanacetum coccineum]|uniref:Reverse transcriptase domain-containing protein n=1 Tax=Tanacetum coccineum TaxID=301880 RepID=A0ABQ4ZM91_9ASTR